MLMKLIPFMFITGSLLNCVKANSTHVLPSSFDLSYETDVTPGCNAFFQRFLSSADFKACKPLSFFITNSYEFAAKTRRVPQNVLMLEDICTTPKVDCQKVMKELRQEMVKIPNCGEDLRAQNKFANSAYVSFINFHLMQRVGCLKNETNGYCFVEALENRTSLSLYFMPYGHQLQSVENSTESDNMCTLCNSKVMDIYGRFGSQYRSPLGKTFKASKDIIIEKCGRGYLKTHKEPINEGMVVKGQTKILILIGALALSIFSP
ncbi:hypothetical protein K7432_000170 [Basidiobolus ranarum]|uniref:DUF7729 domain-containing protein n=1 Tax=Basidiobolus ranarum TaxID=34480 RepID=A0ABR2X4X4_9FUNG